MSTTFQEGQMSTFFKVRKLLRPLAGACFLLFMAFSADGKSVQVIDSSPQVEQFEQEIADHLQEAKREDASPIERKMAIQEAIGALGELKKKFCLKNLDKYKPTIIDEIKKMLWPMDAATSAAFSTPNPEIGQMQLLHEHAQALWLYAHLLLTWFTDDEQERRERRDTYTECEKIYEKLADLTPIDRSLGNTELLELGAQSRLWLAILPLVKGELAVADARLQPLHDYLRVVENQEARTDKIENAIWVSKLVECETQYALRRYERCVELVDHYFSNILDELTPDSPETYASACALEALRHKILSLQHIYGTTPELFGRSAESIVKELQAEAVRPLSPDEIAQRVKILRMAEFLASFEDKHVLPDSEIDYLTIRINLLDSCYLDARLWDKSYELEKKYYSLYPDRFEHYAIGIEVYEMGKQLDSLRRRK